MFLRTNSTKKKNSGRNKIVTRVNRNFSFGLKHKNLKLEDELGLFPRLIMTKEGITVSSVMIHHHSHLQPRVNAVTGEGKPHTASK